MSRFTGVLGRLQMHHGHGRIDRLGRRRARPRDIDAAADFAMPPGGLNIRWPDPLLDQEMRLHQL